MARYYVIQGKLAHTPGKSDTGVANVGDVVELSEAQAGELLKAGVLATEEKFRGMVKQAEGALEAGMVPEKSVRKLAEALKLSPKPKAEEKQEKRGGKS